MLRPDLDINATCHVFTVLKCTDSPLSTHIHASQVAHTLRWRETWIWAKILFIWVRVKVSRSPTVMFHPELNTEATFNVFTVMISPDSLLNTHIHALKFASTQGVAH